MASREPLAVWLYDTRIATLREDSKAAGWGLPAAGARRTVDEVVARIAAALATTPRPDGLHDAGERLQAFWQRRSWLVGGDRPPS